MYYRSYQIDYLCGWRYLFSASFRKQARKKWGGNIYLWSLYMIGSITSLLLTTAVSVLLIMAVLHLFK